MNSLGTLQFLLAKRNYKAFVMFDGDGIQVFTPLTNICE